MTIIKFPDGGIDNTRPLFLALQQVAEHCDTDEVATAAASLAASAICDGETTLAEAEIKCRVLGNMMMQCLRENWIKLYGTSGERYVKPIT